MREHKFTLPVGATITIGGEAMDIEVGSVITIVAEDNRVDEIVRGLEEVRARRSKEPTVVIGAWHDGRVSEAWAKQMREFAAAVAGIPDTIVLHPDTFRRLVKGPQRQRAQWKDERNRKYRR